MRGFKQNFVAHVGILLGGDVDKALFGKRLGDDWYTFAHLTNRVSATTGK